MSLEAWGSGADDGLEGYVTDDRAEEMFIAGAQAMREMLARFVENGPKTDPKTLAASLRANWVLTWGNDPGKPSALPRSAWD